jgi:hypothetical protein
MTRCADVLRLLADLDAPTSATVPALAAPPTPVRAPRPDLYAPHPARGLYGLYGSCRTQREARVPQLEAPSSRLGCVPHSRTHLETGAAHACAWSLWGAVSTAYRRTAWSTLLGHLAPANHRAPPH